MEVCKAKNAQSALGIVPSLPHSSKKKKKKVGCFRGFVLSMIFFKSMAILINKTFCHNRRAKLWFTIKRGTLNIQRPFSSITGSCVRQDSPCRRLNTAHVLKCFSMSLPVTRIHTSIKRNNVQVGITCTNATLVHIYRLRQNETHKNGPLKQWDAGRFNT